VWLLRDHHDHRDPDESQVESQSDLPDVKDDQMMDDQMMDDPQVY
jgi:hypothetical protein